jgi:hypothetical protein
MVVIKRALALIALLAMVSALAAQTARVDASLNKTTVFKSDPVIYTISVSASYRAKITEPSPPLVKGLRFSYVSTSSRTSTTYQNLRAVSRYVTEFRYQYYPLNTGKFTFPAQTVIVDGNTFTTPLVSVEVKPDPQHQSPSPSQPSFNFGWNPFDQDDPWDQEPAPREEGKSFILALPENQSVYRGQPALVSYYLYTNQDVRSYNDESTSDFGGYGKEIYSSATQLQFERAAYGGQNYRRAFLKSYAIYPQRTGELKVPQISATVRWSYYSFFEQAVDSSPARITVRELPSGAPSSFNGALGRFEISGVLSRREARVGNAVTYTLRIKGLGNFNQFSAPIFPRSQDLQISAPLARDNLKGGCDGTRELVYTVIPRRAGNFALPQLIFSWLDTETGTYQTYRSAPASINVTQSGGTSALYGGGNNGGIGTTYPMIDRQDYPDHRPYFLRWWFWLLALAMPGSLLYSVATMRRRKRLEQDPQARANRMAELELFKLRAETASLAPKSSQEYYAAAGKGILAYISALFQLEPHLSTAEIMDELSDRGIPLDLLQQMKDFLGRCQQTRFAPSSIDPDSISADHQNLLAIIAAMESFRHKALVYAKGHGQ